MDPCLHHIMQRLATVYPEGEARAIARLVLETGFGLSQTDLCMGRGTHLLQEKRHELENIVNRLVQKEPVQYVLGQADFGGRTFCVGPGVLIPRSETEELAAWVASAEQSARPRLLDIGTGSGCLAVTLALDIPQARVSALDISADAIRIARQNAMRLGAQVEFLQGDILQWADNEADDGRRWDVVVSNPPYVCERERRDMDANVLDYEPATALFVPDHDPLLFYRAIGRYALRSLAGGGRLYVEINRAYGPQTMELFRALGLRNIELRKDAYGHERMIRCER